MRHFNSQARTINLVRKVGYYPSLKVAQRCAKALCFVTELDDKTELVVQYLTGVDGAWERLSQCTTPAEFRILSGFSEWYGCESTESEDPSDYRIDLENVYSSYVAINLNTGYCYVFTSSHLAVITS